MIPRKTVPRLLVSLCRRPASSGFRASNPARFSRQTSLPQLGKALKLQTYSDTEIGEAFDKADANANGLLEPHEVEGLVEYVRYEELRSFVSAGKEEPAGISREVFIEAVGKQADRLDFRVYPIAGSLVLTGFAIGIFGPATPLLIQQLGLTTTQTGFLTTGFAMSKMLGNIPFGVASDKYGRRPVIVFGGACLTVGTLGVGAAAFTSSYEIMVLSRVVTGIGVSALITGAFVAAADISTPRNRARSMAPISIGFNFGNAFGPFAAGVMISGVGLTYTFCGSAALLGLNTLTSIAMVKETMPPQIKSTQGFLEAFQASVRSWVPLLQSAHLRQATMYQGLFWGCFGAGFMTCLPIYLGSAELGLSASSIAMCYGSIAVTNIFAAQPLAMLTDKVGKEEMMIGGMGILGLSLAGLPLCHDVTTLPLALTGWAVGSTILFPVPQAIAADHTGPEDRSNALAMVRTLGDVGMVGGGILASLLGATCSIETILSLLGATCVGTATSSAGRRFLRPPSA